MKATRRSRTAEAAALARALHLIRDGEPKVFQDPYAIQFVSRFWLVWIKNDFLYWLGNKNPFMKWARLATAEILMRNRYAEDRLELSLSTGIRQYVLLSAGFDSFALRRPDLCKSIKVFEVDHPATQRWKLDRYLELGMDSPKEVIYIPVDFEHETLAEALSASSFSSDEPAFFSWLGTASYLSKAAILETLEAVSSQSTVGTEIVFDYIDAEPFTGGLISKDFRRMMRFAARQGEPFIFGFDHEELVRDLRRFGFELIERLSPAEQYNRYFAGRSDRLTTMEHLHIACARIG